MKYWYQTTTYECPVCGSEKSYKSRMYTPKPEKWEERHILRDYYDYCNV